MLPILQVVLPEGEEETNAYAWKESKDAKEGKMIHSQFLNGLDVKEAINKAIDYIEENKLGFATTNYRLRDAIFSRQRYWGEPFPIYYKDGIPYALDEKELPLLLPEVDSFLPTETGEPPLARAKNWCTKKVIHMKPTLCLVLLVATLILLDTWTQQMKKNSSQKKLTLIGKM